MSTTTLPADLARFPLPEWATDGEWEVNSGYVDPIEGPYWERFAKRTFGEYTVDEYQTWSPKDGYKGFGLTLFGDPLDSGVNSDNLEAGLSLADYARGLAADLIAAAELIDSVLRSPK